MPNDEAEDILVHLKERRSRRKFTSEPVARDLLLKVIDYATWAPSACNFQNWRFVVVDDDKIKNRIKDGGGSVLIPQSPAGILVTYRRTVRNNYYHDDIQSAGACIQNLLLAAEAYGLGACWLCTLPSKGYLRNLFNMPGHYDPLAYIIVGHPANDPKSLPRKHDIGELTGFNSFPEAFQNEKCNMFKECIERILVSIYRFTPLFIKKIFLNKLIDKKFTRKFDN